MTVNVDQVLEAVTAAGKQVFADNWGTISTYAETEFKKMSQQMVDIAANVAKHEADASQGYTAEVGKMLMDMQRLSTVNVLIAMSAMTLVAAQQALNAMLEIVKNTLGGVIGAIL